jgi:hypothetical protein
MKNSGTAHVEVGRAFDNSHMLTEKRFENREPIALPVILGGNVVGTTWNLSTTGLFFETANACQVGSQIDLTIDLSTVGRPFYLKARGEVLRTQDLGERAGVAVKMSESKLESVM